MIYWTQFQQGVQPLVGFVEAGVVLLSPQGF
jgi:hypothetical protein